MENFDPKNKKEEAAVSPEVEEYQKLIDEIKKNESSVFSSHAGREELSKKLEQAAKQLAEHDIAFKDALVGTFKEHVEHRLSDDSDERWMDKVFISAFSKYQGI